MIRLKSLVTEAMISEALRYHINKNISIHDNVFRYGSEAYCNLMLEAKRLLSEGTLEADVYDREVLSTDIGEFGLYEGVHVPLDLPMSEAEYQGKNVEVGKPKRGGSKKFYVYVRNPKTGKIKKVSFGAKDGGGNLSVKLKDPKARKRFADRHNCEQKNDRTTPGYWSCRLPRYAKQLGLSGGGRFW